MITFKGVVMLSILKAKVKSSKFLYRVYYHTCSSLVRFMGLFVKNDPNLILFVSYGGQKYDDSPRVIYEYLQNHPVSDQHKYVWAFVNPNEFPQVSDKVKIDTVRYYLTALRAGGWITNSSASRGLNFKKENTKNFLFVHGMTGIKKIGLDIHQTEKSYVMEFREKFDAVFLEGKKEIPILTRAWSMNPEVFHITGLPRNDNLISVDEEEILGIKKKLNIPADKKVILYAPTFRETSRSGDGRNELGIPFDFSKWEDALGAEYVMLITAHYEVAKLLDQLPDNEFVINAFKYPELNDLIKVSDILVSDYSSIVFDYSIMERPIFCYGYDYDTYAKERGLYTDLDQLFSHGVLRTENDLLNAIIAIDYKKECEYTKKYIKDEYIASCGNAAETAVRIIFGEETV